MGPRASFFWEKYVQYIRTCAVEPYGRGLSILAEKHRFLSYLLTGSDYREASLGANMIISHTVEPFIHGPSFGWILFFRGLFCIVALVLHIKKRPFTASDCETEVIREKNLMKIHREWLKVESCIVLPSCSTQCLYVWLTGFLCHMVYTLTVKIISGWPMWHFIRYIYWHSICL